MNNFYSKEVLDLTLNEKIKKVNSCFTSRNIVFYFSSRATTLKRELRMCLNVLKKMRLECKPLKNHILIFSREDEKIYYFKTEDYMKFINKDEDNFKVLDYKVFSLKDYVLLKEFLVEDYPLRFSVKEDNLFHFIKMFYTENESASKEDLLKELKEPFLYKDLIEPLSINIDNYMDSLNNPLKRKNTGAFYTPEPYVKLGVDLLRKAISRVPEGNDYIILDRCSGTGNLEALLTDEELSHCILSTYEINEYEVLENRFKDKVRHLIEPLNVINGFIENANALSKEYLDNEIIKQYIDNDKCSIILLENPPYADTTSIELQKKAVSKKCNSWKQSYVLQEMRKEVKGSALNDIVNAFIWSAFKYYLRKDTDSYIVYSPVKYWKSQHFVNKKFIEGYGVNRKHFNTNSDACVMIALWSNEDDYDIQSLELKAYDIKNNNLEYEGVLNINKIYTRFSDIYYDKRKFNSDIQGGILVGYNGLEAFHSVKKGFSPIYNSLIIGYLIAHSCGFDSDGTISSLLIASRYDGHGCYLRKDNYIEKLSMFAASRYVRYVTRWTERSRIMKSADGADNYFKDIKNGKLQQQLLKVLLFCCLEIHNHMRSFKGSDNRFYRNELCLDTTNGETIASISLKDLIITDKEKAILDLWYKIFNEAVKTENYDSSLTYGLYQINEELNTYHKEDGKRIYHYPLLNDYIKEMKLLVKDYYITEIVPFLFEYEFLK